MISGWDFFFPIIFLNSCSLFQEKIKFEGLFQFDIFSAFVIFFSRLKFNLKFFLLVVFVLKYELNIRMNIFFMILVNIISMNRLSKNST